MQGKHWGMLIVVLLIGYALGVWKPMYGQQAVAAVGLS